VITAAVVDRALRRVTLGALVLFIAAAVLLSTGEVSGVPAVVGLVLWGLGFGGAATQMQAALAGAAGPDTDAAVSVFTVAFDLAIAVGGVIGAVLVEGTGAAALPAAMGAAALVAFGAVASSHRTAFPAGR
jgi:predicted MFS family arabinose efflux permease